jgi:2-methylcitrate dehydratase PrpD
MTSALAIADHLDGLAGQELIAALVAGVEVASRVQGCVGRVPQVTLGFHGPGVVGTFAAAACAGRAVGLEAGQMVDAFGHAGQQTGGLMATQHGGMGKRLLAGKAAHSGTLAALLAAHGFTNVPDIFECEYGGFCSTFTGGGTDYRLDELTRGLGSEWASAELNFKMWPCRVPIHPTLEAIRSLQVEHAFDAEQVRRVRVWLDEGAYKAVGWPWVPTTQTSAQLNLTYCAAQLILEGDVFVEQFAVEKLGHPRVMDMASRIDCIYDRDMDAFGTFQQRTRVEVELTDGRVLGAIGRTRGTAPDNQLTDKPVREKFQKVTHGFLSDSAQAALIKDCERLDALDDVRELADLMQPAAQPAGPARG